MSYLFITKIYIKMKNILFLILISSAMFSIIYYFHFFIAVIYTIFLWTFCNCNFYEIIFYFFKILQHFKSLTMFPVIYLFWLNIFNYSIFRFGKHIDYSIRDIYLIWEIFFYLLNCSIILLKNIILFCNPHICLIDYQSMKRTFYYPYGS